MKEESPFEKSMNENIFEKTLVKEENPFDRSMAKSENPFEKSRDSKSEKKSENPF